MENESYVIPRTLVLCQFCEFSGPSICFCTQSVAQHYCSDEGEEDTDASSNNSMRVCEKGVKDVDECCRILPGDKKYLVSHEIQNHRTYISTTRPPLKDYSIVQNALLRSNNEHCAASDIVMLSNNKGYTRSTVVTRFFQIKDTESRGQVRNMLLMMVVSERFAAIDHISDLHEKMGQIIKVLVDKSEAAYQSDMSERKFDIFKNSTEKRNPSNLLKFDNLYNFLHEKFSKLHYLLENKHLPLIIVPPGKVDEIKQMKAPPCYCDPPQAGSSTPGRDRAQTLVELPAPRFTSIDELEDLLGKSQFKEVITNIVIGNQIVVRGEAALTVESVLSLFSTFLPPNCVKNDGYVANYRPNYCKFIGLPLSASVPQSKHVLVIDVTPTQDIPQRHFKLKLRAMPLMNASETPTIVEEILNLVSLSRNQTHETYKKVLAAILSRWSGKARIFSVYMKSPRPAMDKERDENAILEILEVRKRDIPVLKFFVNSLRKEERIRLLKEVQ